MKRLHALTNGKLLGLALATLMALTAGNVRGADGIGNGYSTLKDPKAAGAEAAAKAKKALGYVQPKFVLVFDSVGGGQAGKEAMLKGVTSVFDASIVYGCSAYAPITQDCNTGTVGVMAVGGEIEVVAATAEVGGDHAACGRKIGQALKKDVPTDSTGHVILLFGACHVPSNDKLVGGVVSVLGEKAPIVGGAAKGDLLYVQGKILPQSNLGLMVRGDFQCGFSAKNAPAKDKQRVIAVAGEAAKEALGPNKDKAVLLLTFDCGGRRGQMGGEIDKELALIKDAAGDIPIFGFYGSGETGPKDNDSVSRGVGYHIVVCAISAK